MGPEEALVTAGTARQRKGDYVPGETTPQLTSAPRGPVTNAGSQRQLRGVPSSRKLRLARAFCVLVIESLQVKKKTF